MAEAVLPSQSASIIVPCFNEENSVAKTIEEITMAMASSETTFDCILVDDGSTDGTAARIRELQQAFPSVRLVRHDVNRGYGAALKTGIQNTDAELIAIIDADGTYPTHRLPELIKLCADYDMVVGARTGANVTYSKLRAFPKYFMRRWVSWIANRDVPDINSGMRVFRRSVSRRFLGILPDGFSFTITITLAMLTNKHPTLFVPIDYHARIGSSKIRPIRDTIRFLTIIGRTGVYFAPVRIFIPIFALLFFAGVGSFIYDVMIGNLSDKTVLLFMMAMNAGMFAMVADMLDKRLK